MENLKIRVNSADESREAQELFQKLVGKENGFITMDKSIRWVVLYKGQVVQYEFLPSVELNEITLPELRAMVNQEQGEPFLTPECTLNDQYAEIEQVRQTEIHGTVKAKPDFNFGAAQAIKVKSGSDSDHAADAMSFGLMGAGAANGGAKMRENKHYFIDVSDVNEVDFYEIAKRYNVTDPAIQHILKKCLAIGNRGHKDLETDLKDILKTAKRALQINGFGE